MNTRPEVGLNVRRMGAVIRPATTPARAAAAAALRRVAGRPGAAASAGLVAAAACGAPRGFVASLSVSLQLSPPGMRSRDPHLPVGAGRSVSAPAATAIPA